MAELTLEVLAKRVETLERILNVIPPESNTPVKDWRLAVGMFTGSEFMKLVHAEGKAIRERDREEARREFGE